MFTRLFFVDLDLLFVRLKELVSRRGWIARYMNSEI